MVHAVVRVGRMSVVDNGRRCWLDPWRRLASACLLDAEAEVPRGDGVDAKIRILVSKSLDGRV